MNMKSKWKPRITAVAIPLAVGGLSALLTRDAMKGFAALDQPPLSPPGWLFPVVWTVLFLLMGMASYLVWEAPDPRGERRKALTVYGIQLAVNFLWSIFFFNLGWYLFSFAWIVLLWVLIMDTVLLFWRLSHAAGMLLLPYLIWVTFAGYLNFGIYLLN